MATFSIYLPKNHASSLKVGDIVKAGQVLPKDAPAAHVTYDLVKLLSIAAKDIGKVVIKREGEEVAKGEVLAKKSGMLSGKTIIATLDGTIEKIDEEKGFLILAPSQIEKTVVIAPVDGKIKKIADDGITMDFDGIVVFAKQGIGEVKKGKIAVVGNAGDEVTLSDINSDHKEKVVLGGHFTKQVLEKAFGIGVVSVLVTSVDEGEFGYFEQKSFYEASICLISKADYETVAKHEGKEAVVEGKHKRVIIPE